MCGIAGIIGPAGMHNFINPALKALGDRGPDGAFTFLEGPLELGSTRLAIVDPQNGTPPFLSNDRRWVVFGAGEVYNARELRLELEGIGCAFRSGCDLEVVAHGVAVWGESILSRLAACRT
jgi:asparagine synthase (glutamine-hydrolysing)